MDFNESNKAIYLQIADVICDKVLEGTLRPADRVPSVREYAATVMVNVNTVMRTYDYLSTMGVIYNKRGVGYFVADDAGGESGEAPHRGTHGRRRHGAHLTPVEHAAHHPGHRSRNV